MTTGRSVSLHPVTQNLWDEYVAAERDRVRGVAMPALDRFIESLLRREDPARWQAWAAELAVDVADGRSDLPVRLPLFRSVLLPALAAGVLAEVPRCARALAHFELHLAHTDTSALPGHLRTAEGLLEEALRIDPGDRVARERLVERWERYLDYTLHELPAGVLYGSDAATAEQCDDLLALLQKFRAHVQALDHLDDHADLIAACALHFARYREYVARGCPGGSYARFLQSEG